MAKEERRRVRDLGIGEVAYIGLGFGVSTSLDRKIGYIKSCLYLWDLDEEHNILIQRKSFSVLEVMPEVPFDGCSDTIWIIN